MKWVLIFSLYYHSGGVTTNTIEDFEDINACLAAAHDIQQTWQEVGYTVTYDCVTKEKNDG